MHPAEIIVRVKHKFLTEHPYSSSEVKILTFKEKLIQDDHKLQGMLNTKGGRWGTTEEETTMDHEGYKKTSANQRENCPFTYKYLLRL